MRTKHIKLLHTKSRALNVLQAVVLYVKQNFHFHRPLANIAKQLYFSNINTTENNHSATLVQLDTSHRILQNSEQFSVQNWLKHSCYTTVLSSGQVLHVHVNIQRVTFSSQILMFLEHILIGRLYHWDK